MTTKTQQAAATRVLADTLGGDLGAALHIIATALETSRAIVWPDGSVDVDATGKDLETLLAAMTDVHTGPECRTSLGGRVRNHRGQLIGPVVVIEPVGGAR